MTPAPACRCAGGSGRVLSKRWLDRRRGIGIVSVPEERQNVTRGRILYRAARPWGLYGHFVQPNRAPFLHAISFGAGTPVGRSCAQRYGEDALILVNLPFGKVV